MATKIRLRVTSLGMTVVLFLSDAELRAGEGHSLTGVLSSKFSAIGLTTLGDANTPAPPAPLWFSGPQEPLRGAADFLAGSGMSTTSGWRLGMGLTPPSMGTGIPGSRESTCSLSS